MPKLEFKSSVVRYIFDSDLVWRMQIMIIENLKIHVLCVRNFEPLMLIN